MQTDYIGYLKDFIKFRPFKPVKIAMLAIVVIIICQYIHAEGCGQLC